MRGDIVLTTSALQRGTQKKAPINAFFDNAISPRSWSNYADGAQISRKIYSNFLRMSERETPRALAILTLVRSVGFRLLLSIKLIAGRVTPAFSAKVSCERPCSLRNLANSAATCSITFSEAMSLMERMIADLRYIENVTNVTKGRLKI